MRSTSDVPLSELPGSTNGAADAYPGDCASASALRISHPSDQDPSQGIPDRKIRVLLNREGWNVGNYLVYRLNCEEGLCLQRMRPAGKRKASRPRAEKFKATAPDQAWNMEFVADQLRSGTRFRSLTIVDVCS